MLFSSLLVKILSKESFCSDHLKNEEELCIWVYFSFFFLFSTQNQVPQITIRMGRMIYHIKAISIVIRTKFKKFEKLFTVERERIEIFDF